MDDLRLHLRAVGVDRVGDRAVRVDHVVGREVHRLRHLAVAAVDHARLERDQAHAAARARGEIVDQARRRELVEARIAGRHRRHDDPVLQLHAADPDRLEELHDRVPRRERGGVAARDAPEEGGLADREPARIAAALEAQARGVAARREQARDHRALGREHLGARADREAAEREHAEERVRGAAVERRERRRRERAQVRARLVEQRVLAALGGAVVALERVHELARRHAERALERLERLLDRGDPVHRLGARVDRVVDDEPRAAAAAVDHRVARAAEVGVLVDEALARARSRARP